MSYQQTVLRDDPVAYWPLTGTSTIRTYASILEQYNSYNEWLNSEANYAYESGSITFEDVSVNKNHAAVAFGTQLPTFLDILTLNSRLFSDTANNGCKLNDNSVISVFDIYSFFDKNYEGGVFGAEFWVLFNDAPDTKTNLFSVVNGSTVVAEAYAHNDFIYFTLNTSGGSYTTKKRLTSWDKKVHVYLSYSERKLEVMVNGVSDESVAIPANDKFTMTTNLYVKYKLGPAATGKSFTINDVALYTYKLSQKEIQNHIFWAGTDSGPDHFAQQSNAYHFDIKARNEMIHIQKQFSSAKDYDQGSYVNLIPDNTGLTIKKTLVPGTLTGTWYYSLPIVQNINFAGISIYWDTATSRVSSGGDKNVRVYSSYDQGVTWYEVLSNELVPFFLQNSRNNSNASLLIKVQIYSPDTSIDEQPRLDNLSVKLYKTLNVAADSGGFIMNPTSGSTYMIKEHTDNLLSRHRNLGINFVNQTPGTGYPGSAVITSSNNTSYKTIEFWFKYASTDATTAAVLDTATISGVDLSISNGTNLLSSNLGANATLYINGVPQVTNSYSIVPGATYFITVVYNQSTTNPIYINGSTDGSVASPSAMYGYITMFPSALSATEVQTRYLSYLATQTAVVYDSTTTLGTILEYIGSTPTSLNGGLAVISHDHTY
jgi:Concanavalin A-like lectin/glucanases superfamily